MSEPELPESVLFVGGGVIALEFGHVYARAGAKVTILEVLPQLLPALDADAVEQVRKESRRIGIVVHTGVKVKRVERASKRLRTVFEVDGKELSIESDRVVNGAGRIANVDQLDLEAGNIAHEGFRVPVDETCARPPTRRFISAATCCPVRRSCRRSPPMKDGWSARNIVEGPKHKPDYANAAIVASTPSRRSPPSACPRPRPRSKGLKTRVQVNDMEYWFSTRTFAETVAWSKIVVEEESDAIVGAHFVGHAGEELINFFGLAMKHGITASQIRDFVFAYPTFSADIKSML